mgnify:FL=1|jgi:hypothetical protein|tara:strand:- start:1415 stop:2353 length:939 start_codon:yes stop_codon:yes gene_type:complete
MNNIIGKLKRVPLREVWKHEAKDFTTWLQNNIDVLNEVIDISINSAEREQSAGSFNVDLVAEDVNGNVVVIENQLEKSNHDHLGKIITYLTSVGAKAAIWIVADARPEHVNAINWLNESSSADFYLIKLEAIKIEDSPAAPLFTLIVGPSEEGRVIGATKKELAERYGIRLRFWTGLLNLSKEKTKLHSNISPNKYNWIGTSAGKRGLGYNYVARKHDTNVELYVDRGENNEQENLEIFHDLLQSKDEIEATFGESLEWQRLENRRACRIVMNIKLGGWKDEDRWPEIHTAMLDNMMRFEKSFRGHIRTLKI